MKSVGEDKVTALSIVAPCFNEEEVLPAFIARALLAAQSTGLSYELILVDDGSSDSTWQVITEAAETNLNVRGIRLLRNHGHQLALSAGLRDARGDLVLAIDADLQDPPELVREMIALLYSSRADVVYGQRRNRRGETWFKVATARIFYRTLRRLTSVDIPIDTGDFRLMKRNVVDVFNSMPERHRFVRGMIAWIGGRQVAFLYDRDPRHAGESKYPLRKMVRFAKDAITSFSSTPLSFANYVGVVAGLVSFGLGLAALLSFFLSSTVAGWTSIVAILTFQFSLMFFCIGLIGENVGRLFEMNKGRPLFLIGERIGLGLTRAANDEKTGHGG